MSQYTVSELKEKNRALAKENELLRRVNRKRKKRLDILQIISDNAPAPIYLKDTEGKYIAVNRKFEYLANVTLKKIKGKTDFDFFPTPVAELFRSQDEEVKKQNIALEFEETIPLSDGEYTFLTLKFPVADIHGSIFAIGGFCTDITARIEYEKKQKCLIKDLQKVQGSLHKEVVERHQIEQALLLAKEEVEAANNSLEQRVLDRTTQLDLKTEKLQQTNIALNILLEKREEDKKELEADILFNVEKLIYPFLEKVKQRCTKASQGAFLEIIQSNLDEITSSFAHNHKNALSNLTPAQLQIANLIKQGLTTKEVASVLDLSPATIACHRQEIRKRLSLSNTKINLQTALTTNNN